MVGVLSGRKSLLFVNKKKQKNFTHLRRALVIELGTNG
jgi:hypothetical protein